MNEWMKSFFLIEKCQTRQTWVFTNPEWKQDEYYFKVTQNSFKHLDFDGLL